MSRRKSRAWSCGSEGGRGGAGQQLVGAEGTAAEPGEGGGGAAGVADGIGHRGLECGEVVLHLGKNAVLLLRVAGDEPGDAQLALEGDGTTAAVQGAVAAALVEVADEQDRTAALLGQTGQRVRR